MTEISDEAKVYWAAVGAAVNAALGKVPEEYFVEKFYKDLEKQVPKFPDLTPHEGDHLEPIEPYDKRAGTGKDWYANNEDKW